MLPKQDHTWGKSLQREPLWSLKCRGHHPEGEEGWGLRARGWAWRAAHGSACRLAAGGHLWAERSRAARPGALPVLRGWPYLQPADGVCSFVSYAEQTGSKRLQVCLWGQM